MLGVPLSEAQHVQACSACSTLTGRARPVLGRGSDPPCPVLSWQLSRAHMLSTQAKRSVRSGARLHAYLLQLDRPRLLHSHGGQVVAGLEDAALQLLPMSARGHLARNGQQLGAHRRARSCYLLLLFLCMPCHCMASMTASARCASTGQSKVACKVLYMRCNAARSNQPETRCCPVSTTISSQHVDLPVCRQGCARTLRFQRRIVQVLVCPILHLRQHLLLLLQHGEGAAAAHGRQAQPREPQAPLLLLVQPCAITKQWESQGNGIHNIQQRHSLRRGEGVFEEQHMAGMHAAVFRLRGT